MFQSLRDIDQDLEPAKNADDLDTVIEMMKEPDDQMPPEDLFYLDKAGTAEPQVSKYYPNCNKSRVLFSSAEMFKKPLWQTVWTQVRLLL